MLVSQRELSRILPGYDVSTSTGAAVWYDAQIYNNSERLLLEFILSAVDAAQKLPIMLKRSVFYKDIESLAFEPKMLRRDRFSIFSPSW